MKIHPQTCPVDCHESVINNSRMKTKKSGKAKWILIVIGVFLVSLITHIYVTTNDVNDGGHTNWQLSRIDFLQPIDSVEAGKIINTTRAIAGVTQAIFNLEQGTLVYAYFPGTLSSEKVFDQVVKSGNYKAKRYIVTDAMEKRSCPVMTGGEMTRRLALYWRRMSAKFE